MISKYNVNNDVVKYDTLRHISSSGLLNKFVDSIMIITNLGVVPTVHTCIIPIVWYVIQVPGEGEGGKDSVLCIIFFFPFFFFFSYDNSGPPAGHEAPNNLILNRQGSNTCSSYLQSGTLK